MRQMKRKKSAGDPVQPGIAGRYFDRVRASSLAAYAASILALLAYLLQSWKFILHQTSFLDEGVYLYLGSLYARGVLTPFQGFGPRSIYAPLSLLIPGSVQAWFGSGLLSGRLFSLFLGLLALAGLWLTARRLGSNWGAALAVAAVALTPAQVMVFSTAISEVLVACMLVWMLFFTLGKERSLPQVIAGSLLAGLLVMTRQNLAPVVPLLVGYIFWQHGRKAGWCSLGASLLPIVSLHAVYWPNILILWARWLPAGLTPFLDGFRPIGDPAWAGVEISLLTRLNALFAGLLYNFIPALGALFATLLLPARKHWQDQERRRTAVFLAALFWVLFIIHAWVTVMDNSSNPCTFCFTPYLSFFSVTGLLLVCASFPSLKRILGRPAQAAILVLVLILGTGLGFARFDQLGAWLLHLRLPAIQRGWPPGSWFPGFSMADVLANRFRAEDFWEARLYISALAGLVAAGLLAGLAYILYRRVFQKRSPGKYTFGYALLLIVLVSGAIVSPLTRGEYREQGICSADMPAVYQEIGTELVALIPPGSRVYWGVSHTVPLLYAPDIAIHPVQMYGDSSYRLAEDSRELLRLGYFNEDIRQQLMEEADFLVIEPNPLASYRTPDLVIHYARYSLTTLPPLNPCNPESYLLVYARR